MNSTMNNNTSTSVGSAKRFWIGPWLMAVAALHTVFGLLVFGPVLRQLVGLGWIDSVGADPMRGAVAWFLLCGPPLAMLALTITPLQRSGQHATLRRLGWCTLALAALGISLMPASGFWLVLPAGFALVRS